MLDGVGDAAVPEVMRDRPRKLLLADEKIVAQALERALASGDLVRETIGGQELILTARRAKVFACGQAQHGPNIAPTMDHTPENQASLPRRDKNRAVGGTIPPGAPGISKIPILQNPPESVFLKIPIREVLGEPTGGLLLGQRPVL